MTILEKIQEKENRIKKAEALVNSLQARGEVYKEQYLKKQQELKELGIDPKNIEKEKAKLEEEIIKLTKEVDELLPDDVLDKYVPETQDNVLDNKVMDNVDLTQDF